MATISHPFLLGLVLIVLVCADEERKRPPRGGCVKTSDCPYGNCCMLNKDTNRGYCKTMQKTAQTCYWKQEFTYPLPPPDPEAMVTKYDLCPCGFGGRVEFIPCTAS